MEVNKKAQGSFGIPDDMMKEINRSKKKAASAEQSESPTTDIEEMLERAEAVPDDEVNTGAQENTEESERESTLKKIQEALVEIRKSLGVEITEDDIWSFLFNNNITKRHIIIVPGKMHATFRTITLDETNEIDSKMAVVMEEARLESGFKNVNTQHILSKGLMELGKPGHLKSLGETTDERFKAIGKMSSLLVEKLTHKWNEFIFLVDETVKEEMEVKKA